MDAHGVVIAIVVVGGTSERIEAARGRGRRRGCR
jgi:hypothetical protein